MSRRREAALGFVAPQLQHMPWRFWDAGPHLSAGLGTPNGCAASCPTVAARDDGPAHMVAKCGNGRAHKPPPPILITLNRVLWASLQRGRNRGCCELPVLNSRPFGL